MKLKLNLTRIFSQSANEIKFYRNLSSINRGNTAKVLSFGTVVSSSEILPSLFKIGISIALHFTSEMRTYNIFNNWTLAIF
jgi:hypothetical protein